MQVKAQAPSQETCRCAKNGQSNQKFENLVHYRIPSRVQRKKFGKLWFTNYGDLEVQLYPENRIFRNMIFRPLGGAAPRNIYTRYRMSKSC